MKKVAKIGSIIIIGLTISILFLCIVIDAAYAWGNKQWFDTTYSFERAIIGLPNGQVIEGTVDGWTDFEDGDQIQVKINGITYLTHISNVCLISE